MGPALGSAGVAVDSFTRVARPAVSAPSGPEIGRHRRPAPPKPTILTVPLALRGVRARPRRLAVLGVLLLLVAAVVVLGVRVAWARASARPQPIAASAHGPPGGLVARTVPAAFASMGATGTPTAAGVLLVHVVGQVRRPAVVRLPAGARVLDAVTAAGGVRPSADLKHLNLARPVTDGEQIVVPKPGEAIATVGVPGAGGVGAGSTGPGPTGAGSGNALVDLNTADASALDSLPGVGPVLAQRILDWRTQHGRFSSVDEVGEVSGIGDKLLAQIRPKVRV
jgi:comEA protein